MRCLSCGTMNEPGFRFCGSCGARHEGSAASVAPGAAPGAANGAAAMGGQQMVSDGVGVAAPALARPRRMTDAGQGMGAGESMGLPRRSKAPLVVLLAVDAALAVGGALLLRAGLASPAVANAATQPTEPSGGAAAAGAGNGEGGAAKVAAAPVAPVAVGATGGGEAVGAGSAALAPPAAAAPPPAAATDPTAPPSAVAPTENAAGGGDKSGAAAPAAEPEAPAQSFAPGEPAPGTSPDRTVDKNEKADDAAARKKKKEKRSAAEGPVDPYAPAPDLSSQINKLFTKGQSKLDKCHSSIARGEGPSQLTLSFRVLADGSLGGIRVLGAPAGAEMLSMCVQAELAKWRVQSGESGEFVRRIQFR